MYGLVILRLAMRHISFHLCTSSLCVENIPSRSGVRSHYFLALVVWDIEHLSGLDCLVHGTMTEGRLP